MQLSLLGIRLYRRLREKKVSLIYLPLVFYWTALFIGTSLPVNLLPKIFIWEDKAEHFAAYFLLSMLFNLMLNFQSKVEKLSQHSSFYTIGIMSFYALVDELHQLFVPGRYCDILDWTSDFLGISLGVLLVYRFIKNFKTAKEEAL